MEECSKCGKELKNAAGKGCHERYCNGKGTGRRSRKEIWRCPLCNYVIKQNRKKHLKSCNGEGPVRFRESKGDGKGWSKGKTYEEIYGGRRAKRIKKELSKKNKGREGSGKAKTKDLEEKRKRKISETMKKNKRGGYRKGSGRGKQGYYKGIWCDSSWELAWVIYHLEHRIKFRRNRDRFKYFYDEEEHLYTPDFILEDDTSYNEIKNWVSDQVKAKIKYFPKNLKLKIWLKEEMQPILEYVCKKYGDNFIELYDNYKKNKKIVKKRKRKNLKKVKKIRVKKVKKYKEKEEIKEKRKVLNNKRLKNIRDVDITKFGWINELSILWGTSHTQVRRYMKKYFPKELSKAFRKKES